MKTTENTFPTILLLIALATLLSGCVLFPQAQYNKAQRTAPYDVVIVPGFPYTESEQEINFVMRLRVFWAYHLIKNGITENVIFSGAAVHTPYVESEIMAQYAQSLGIPAKHIFVESRAEHSTENLFYGYALALKLGFDHIAVATDPVQAILIKINTRKDKLPVDFITANVSMVLNNYNKVYPTLENPCYAHTNDFVPLAERLSAEELKEGTKGDRFRNRYGLVHVSPDNLELINLSMRD
ncbi:MAG: YdcF family protein [Chitinophagales bacterium]